MLPRVRSQGGFPTRRDARLGWRAKRGRFAFYRRCVFRFSGRATPDEPERFDDQERRTGFTYGKSYSVLRGSSSLPSNPPIKSSRRRSYSWSEVIHRAGDESIFPAFERERPRIVNNFAASASSGYEWSSSSEKMNWTRLSNLAVVLVLRPGSVARAENWVLRR